jgi:hypothetical protein
MTEEKKEETAKDSEAPKQAAAVEGVVASAASQAPADQPAKEEKKEALPEKKERPANCEGCKKSIKNKRWYYRNGKYFCTKRCWSATNKKKPAKAEELPA